MEKLAVVKDFTENKVKYRGIYIGGSINSMFEVENLEHQKQYLKHLEYLRNLGYEIKF